MNKPKIYAHCPAGCLWETVHRSDFLKSASVVKLNADSYNYFLLDGGGYQGGSRYKVKKLPNKTDTWGFSLTVVIEHYIKQDGESIKSIVPARYDVALPATDQFDHSLTIQQHGVVFYSTSIQIALEIGGAKSLHSIEIGENFVSSRGVDVYYEIQGAEDVYLVNEDATVEAKDGKNAFIRFSENADGADFTETWSSGQNYVGFATGHEAPTDKSGYTWCLFGGSPIEWSYLGFDTEFDINILDPGIYVVKICDGPHESTTVITMPDKSYELPRSAYSAVVRYNGDDGYLTITKKGVTASDGSLKSQWTLALNGFASVSHDVYIAKIS